MQKRLLIFLAFWLPITLHAQERPNNIEAFVQRVDQQIPQFLIDFSIPGAAISIIDHGEIVLQKGYGLADTEKGEKVTATTGFNIASVSKTFAAWGIMKLVQDGKLELDTPAENYLTRWHLPESDYDANEVTIRRLLSHTAGLSLHGYPGWSPKDKLPSVEESLNGKTNGSGRVEIVLEPGTKYQYSGGGYTILQLIIEEVSGQSFEAYMQSEVLDPLGMHNSSFNINEKIMAASSLEHDNLGEEIDFELFTAQAAAGMHTTIEDLTRFAIANLYQHNDYNANNTVLSAELVQQMMEPALATNGEYGLGYQIKTHNIEKGLVGHGGSNSGWQALFFVDPGTNSGFTVLTNGRSGWKVANLLFCECMNWRNPESPWSDCSQTPPIVPKLKRHIDANGIADLEATYLGLKKELEDAYSFSEGGLNNLGYHYLAREELETALAVFKLNIAMYPYAYNVYDSYGEALLIQGKREEAIENYRQSIRLNPDNDHGKSVLQELGISTDDLVFKIPVEQLQPLAGEYVMVSDASKKITYAVEGENLVRVYPDYNLKLVPLGHNEFVYQGRNLHAVFDTSNPDAITLTVPDNVEFRKVK